MDRDRARVSGTRLLRYDAFENGHSTGLPEPEDYRRPAVADYQFELLGFLVPGEKVHVVLPSMGARALLHAAVRKSE